MGVFGLRMTETSTSSSFGTSPTRVPAGRRSLPGIETFLLAIRFLLLSIKSIISRGAHGRNVRAVAHVGLRQRVHTRSLTASKNWRATRGESNCSTQSDGAGGD